MLLLDADDEMLMLQKRQIFNKYFCSAFGKKKDDIITWADEKFSTPLVTRRNVKYVLGVNILKSAGLDSLHGNTNRAYLNGL